MTNEFSHLPCLSSFVTLRRPTDHRHSQTNPRPETFSSSVFFTCFPAQIYQHFKRKRKKILARIYVVNNKLNIENMFIFNLHVPNIYFKMYFKGKEIHLESYSSYIFWSNVHVCYRQQIIIFYKCEMWMHFLWLKIYELIFMLLKHIFSKIHQNGQKNIVENIFT